VANDTTSILTHAASDYYPPLHRVTFPQPVLASPVAD
jgi:hypothetical protein